MNSKGVKICFIRSLLVMAGLLFTMHLSAQSVVKGTVKDALGEAIIGANVLVKGTTNGVITDLSGNFSLQNVNASSTLVVTYIGYKPQEVACKGQTVFQIVLQDDSQALEEVVVVGYGSLSKKELSSSIVQVDKSKFLQGGMNNPMEMLTGKVAGLNVNNTAAANPNSSSSLQIRGATSISASNDPLVVIDGIPGGSIRNLSAQDIESMTVLKDAGSAAIYGTRGANGVILITTRKGSGDVGSSRVTYDSYFGVNIAKDKPEILSADEFRRSRRGTDYGSETNWYDLLLRDFSYENNQYVSVDGSTKKGFYGASINYKKSTGLDLVSAREEFGARLNLQQRMADDRFEINTSLNARRVNEDWQSSDYWDTALTMNPTAPLYNEDGSYYQPTTSTGAVNPVAELTQNTNNGQRLYVLGSAEAKLHIIRNEKQQLSTSISYSIDYNDLKSNYYTPSTSAESFWNGFKGRAKVQYDKWWTNHLEWLVNYTIDLGQHNFKAVAGYSYEESKWENVYAQNNDFAYDSLLFNSLGSGTYLKDGLASMGSGKSLSKLIGVFGRVNYNWKNLVMASASLRYEGSTKFGKNSKWGYFPSASVAVEMMQLDFMKPLSSKIQSLKPRVSYGVTGRSDFDSYKSLSTYSSRNSYYMDGSWVTGYAPSSNANEDLAWEKSVSTNVGVDFVLFDRFSGSIDYFDRQSRDLLYNYTAPQPPFVYSNILVNVGTTKNTGVEVSLNYDVFRKTPVKWSAGLNFSYGTTKLSKLSNTVYQASYVDLYQKPGVGTSEYFFRISEGSKVGQFYGYEYAGVDENGNMLVYSDTNEKILVSQADASYKRNIGNGTPSTFLSWSNTVRYKNFDLNLMFTGAFGFDIFNMRKYGMGLQGCGTDNVLRSAYLEDSYIKTGGGVISSYFLEKGDYLKLTNVTLGYNFTPKPNKVFSDARLFISAKNLFTLTSYSGNDPSVVSVNGLTPGVDSSSAYPSALQLSMGLTIHFK